MSNSVAGFRVPERHQTSPVLEIHIETSRGDHNAAIRPKANRRGELTELPDELPCHGVPKEYRMFTRDTREARPVRAEAGVRYLLGLFLIHGDGQLLFSGSHIPEF